MSEPHQWTFVLAGELNAASEQQARRTLRAVERLLNENAYVARAFGTAHPPLDEWEEAAGFLAVRTRRRLEQRLAAGLDSPDPTDTPE